MLIQMEGISLLRKKVDTLQKLDTKRIISVSQSFIVVLMLIIIFEKEMNLRVKIQRLTIFKGVFKRLKV